MSMDRSPWGESARAAGPTADTPVSPAGSGMRAWRLDPVSRRFEDVDGVGAEERGGLGCHLGQYPLARKGMADEHHPTVVGPGHTATAGRDRPCNQFDHRALVSVVCVGAVAGASTVDGRTTAIPRRCMALVLPSPSAAPRVPACRQPANRPVGPGRGYGGVRRRAGCPCRLTPGGPI